MNLSVESTQKEDLDKALSIIESYDLLLKRLPETLKENHCIPHTVIKYLNKVPATFYSRMRKRQFMPSEMREIILFLKLNKNQPKTIWKKKN